MPTVLSDRELIDLLREQFELRSARMSSQDLVMKELEETNERLLESEAVKSKFLSNIRNEINNPLSGVMAAASCLENITDLSAAHQMAGLILKESEKLNFQMENIFLAAELEAGVCSPGCHRIDIKAIIGEIIESIQYAIEESGVSVEYTVNDVHAAEFFTDEQMLRSVVVNLLHNSIKFGTPGTRSHMELSFDGEFLTLVVTDHGRGIPKESQSQVFGRFRQVEEGPCKPYMGQGLGLSIVSSLLDLLGGTVKIESVLGEGTVVTVTIPTSSSSESIGLYGNELLFDEDFTEEDGLETF